MANTLKLHRNGASLLAKAFGVGFIVWLDLSDADILCELSKQLTNAKACTKGRSAEVTTLELKATLPKNVASGVIAEHLDDFGFRQVLARAMIMLRDAAILILKLKSLRCGKCLHVNPRVVTENGESLTRFLLR